MVSPVVDGVVYICICNALTDGRLKEAIAQTGGQRPREVYAACGCRAQCGRCVQAIVALLRDHGGPAEISAPEPT